MKNIRKISNTFKKFRKDLDEALYRDKGIKINFYYDLDDQFNIEDLKILKQSLDNMNRDLNDLRIEINK